MKCWRWAMRRFRASASSGIEELRRGGMTIAFVSHDMTAVERLCNRVYFLHQGQVRSEGEPQKVIGDYYNATIFKQAAVNAGAESGVVVAESEAGAGSGDCHVRFLNGDGEEIDTIATGEPLMARIEYRAHRAIEDPVFELFFLFAG